jgi:hypothetical protein
MKTLRLFSIIFILAGFNFGQKIIEYKNWLIEIIGSYCGGPTILLSLIKI